MAGQQDDAEIQRLETVSTERRRLIGQAIIDGLLSPADAAFLPQAADPDYNQGQGNYTQKGGDHKQGGGDYNQSQILDRFGDRFIDVLRDPAINVVTDPNVVRGPGGNG